MRDKRFKGMTNDEFVRMAERQCYLSIKNTQMGKYLDEALLRLKIANVKIKGIKDGTAGN